MKNIILIMASLLLPFELFSQEIESQYSNSVSGNKCARRDIFNYFNMVNMSNSSFENQIKKLGTSVEYGEDFSVIATEQYASGATFGDCIYTFKKSGKLLVILWYGKTNQTCFSDLANRLSEHYVETKDNRRMYVAAWKEKNYGITIERTMESSMMYEIVSITRLADTKK